MCWGMGIEFRALGRLSVTSKTWGTGKEMSVWGTAGGALMISLGSAIVALFVMVMITTVKEKVGKFDG